MKTTKKVVIALLIAVLLPAIILITARLFYGEALYAHIPVLVLITICLTGSVLGIYMYSVFVRPAKKMRQIAEMLAGGELEQEIQNLRSEDIDNISEYAEEIRQHLKEAANRRVEYDNGNRDFIRNISHDLKTPITSIKGYASGILDGVANTPDKLEKYARTIFNKANDMDALIDELSLYAKLDTNRIPYEFAPLDVEEFFHGYADEIAIDLEQQGVDMTYYSYLTGPDKIVGDPEQLRRVMNNIIGNSVKYMDKDGAKVMMRIRDEADEIHVEIEDNGSGIDRKDLPYVFDRFYRTDKSRNSSTGGSGIGLSVVKKIIEDHGGRVWATSQIGVGTVMHFVLRKYKEAET